ncbi:MAG: endolytic transglycosylase MltG [Candidatus Saccharimonas sp.]
MDGFNRPRPQKSVSGFKRPTTGSVEQPKLGVKQTEIAQAHPIAIESPDTTLNDLDPADGQSSDSPSPKSKGPSKLLWVALGLAALLVITVAILSLWYHTSLQAVDASDKSHVRLEVKAGTSLNGVADELQQRGAIKSSLAFTIYAHIHKQQDAIKAGACSLSPSESVSEILSKLVAGCQDFRIVTIYPGATLYPSKYSRDNAARHGKAFHDSSIYQSLLDAGYSEQDVDTALTAQYSGALFTGKPAGTSLEGYVFGETYYIDTEATASQALQEAFTQMQKIVDSDDLVQKYKSEGLDLYQGITLASIVESEMNCEGKSTVESSDSCYADQQQIAQVFLKRLRIGMPLGSDVTFFYAADKLGVAPSVTIDSLYNTRVVVGLPPGPISSPGELALKSVANPASTDYLYFLAGDDGIIYFATNDAGHEANIKNHCAIGCGAL